MEPNFDIQNIEILSCSWLVSVNQKLSVNFSLRYHYSYTLEEFPSYKYFITMRLFFNSSVVREEKPNNSVAGTV